MPAKSLAIELHQKMEKKVVPDFGMINSNYYNDKEPTKQKGLWLKRFIFVSLS